MRHIIIALIIGIAGLITFLSLRPTAPDNKPSTNEEELQVVNRQDVGICIWEKTGLREEPGRNAKRITSLSFGEQVELLGDTSEVKSENRKYIKIRLGDGNIGWVYQYLVAEKAALSVIIEKAEIYRRPDMMTRKDEMFLPTDIVATTESKEDWIKVIGEERKKSGWIMSKNLLSYKENEILLALLFKKALTEKEPYFKRKALLDILVKPEFKKSILISEIEHEFQSVGLKDRLPENRLYITAPNVTMRSEPKKDEGEVVNWLSEGTLCDVVKIGDRESIGNMDDYWYEVEVKGKKGWVYGQYTSKGKSN